MDKIQVIEELFFNILTYSFLLFPLIFIFFQKRKDSELIVLSAYGVLIFLFNFFYPELEGRFGKVYYLVYTFIEYSCFSFIIWRNLPSKRAKALLIAASIGFFIFQIAYFFYGSKKGLDSVPIGVETILILIYIFYSFYGQLRINTTTPIHLQHAFWMYIGILLYLSGTFFFYILINHMPKGEIQPYWFITYIVDIIKNILFSIGVIIFIQFPSNKDKMPKNIPNLDFN